MSIDKAVIRRGARASLAGLVSGYAALALAELVSAAVRPEAGPVTAVGGAAVDRTPAGVKDWAIRTFGADDKLVLHLGILAVIALLAMALGVLALRMRRTGAAGVFLFGLIGAAAALSRPASESFADAVPSLAGGVAGAALLYALTGSLTARPEGDPAAGPLGPDRRRFLLTAASAVVAGTVAGAVGRALTSSRSGVAVASRAAVVLLPPRHRRRPYPAARRSGCRASARSPRRTPTSTGSTPHWSCPGSRRTPGGCGSTGRGCAGSWTSPCGTCSPGR